jgi:preprotein translocase subunit SecF
MRAVEAVRECRHLLPESTPMIRISFLVWMVLGTALAGTAVVAMLAVPTLASEAMKNIPLAVLLGFVAAMPLSYVVATKIGEAPAR